VINSGMIAIVFKGTDASGNSVIVKLRRRDIVKQLEKGCASVLAAYNWAKYYWPRNLYIRILRPFILNISDIIDQCDFSREIRNLRQAKEDFEPLEFIHIPAVYNNQIDTEYILMEFIEGSHTLPEATPESVREEYMVNFGTFTTYAFLFNAIQHTDLHNGNFIFTPTGFGIIDYGMAHQATDEVHENVLSIASALKNDTPIHEIDFIETIKYMFDPPLNKDEISLSNQQLVEDICISITVPLRDAMDLDELNLTDNLDRLSAVLNREIVMNKFVYKIMLAFSMMSAKTIIMGPNYPMDKIIKIEKRSLRRAYEMIM